MRHVKFIVPVLLIISLAACNKTSKKEEQPEIKTSLIQGEILNPKEVPLILSIGEKTDTIEIDKNNKFSYSLDINEAKYLSFVYRRNGFQLYVYPGDTLFLTFDADNSNEPVVFNSGSSPASEYLMEMNTIRKNNPAFKDLLYETDINTFLAGSEKLEKEMQDLLSSYTEKINDEHFVGMENKRILYIFYNLKFRYKDYFLYFTEREGALDSVSFFSFANALDMDDESSLVFDSYVKAINNQIYHAFESNGIDVLTEEEQVLGQIKMSKETIENEMVEEAVIYSLIMDYGRYSGFEGIDEVYQEFIENAKDENRKIKAKQLYSTWEPLKAGKTAPDFTFPDENGEMKSLSDFRGKLVYIDVWATWCGPCRIEAPHFGRLEMEYKNENIAFLSVSVDDNKEPWLKFIEEEQPDWTQLHTGGWDCSICNDYFIKGIPRFILVDTEGKIIDATAPRPSSDEIRPLLDKLLGIEV